MEKKKSLSKHHINTITQELQILHGKSSSIKGKTIDSSKKYIL